MAQEIERKFVVRDDGWEPGPGGHFQRQGYLAITDLGTVRVRIEEGDATLTVKSKQEGLTRAEYEYEIPLADADQMLKHLCGLVIEKTRHFREFGGRTWEIDVFHGHNDGLVTAEVELASEDEEVELPPWAGEEVSHDVRYRVAYLSENPYSFWDD